MAHRRKLRRKLRNLPRKCRRCRLERLAGETFWNGLCAACRALSGQQRRKRTGAKVLAKGKHTRNEERDGQVYRVVSLPPKRRRSRAA
jgi:hypothetical protein